MNENEFKRRLSMARSVTDLRYALGYVWGLQAAYYRLQTETERRLWMSDDTALGAGYRDAIAGVEPDASSVTA